MGGYQSRLLSEKVFGRQVEFTINGKSYKVGEETPANTTLNAFIREHAHLKGTKFMCLEGGCGSCVVSAQFKHPSTQENTILAVNSCLVPIFACHGWAITTVEGIGSKSKGYNKVQSRLAAANGTQCGYCSPGMVMNMYSLLEANPKITMKEVENSFGGNICRCTGYRPILDAFKSLAFDAPTELVNGLKDIEDVLCPSTGKVCSSNGCSKTCGVQTGSSLFFTLKDGANWYRPSTVKEIMEIFDMIGDQSYRLIAGNTGHGVYRVKEPSKNYIDLNGIPELHKCEVRADGLTLGGNVSLTEAMNLFYKLAKEKPDVFSYCKTMADHIDLIANVPVRNTGTLAGNLYMKHQKNEFPSDIFLILEMIGAQLTISDHTGTSQTMGLLQYLTTDMTKKVIVNVVLPALNDKEFVTRSFKIMPRAQNAHAYVNAGFMVKVDKSNHFTVLEKPVIVFGGIHPGFTHATKTEEILNGKKLLSNETLDLALKTLKSELVPDHVLPDATPEYRSGLALSLFYKFVLNLDPMEVSDRYRSGGPILERPLSSGKQEIDTDKKLWPLNQPIPKVEALIQCSGEAEYTNDIPAMPGQVWGQTVLCDRAKTKITKIDPTRALKIEGVVAFFTAKDIPGKNTFVQPAGNVVEDEPIFVDGVTQYAGQCVGVVIAESHALALEAAKKVDITYEEKPVSPVITDIREVLDKKMTDRISERAKLTPTKQKTDVKYEISGRWDLKTQYHYTMETQSCVVVPVEEDQLDVYPSSQWPSAVQEAISIVLNIPEHNINMRVRRLGGGYGCKLTRSNHVAVVTALSAYLLRRPVRIVLTIENNMEWAGKRFPVYSDYKVGVNENGEIQYLNASMYQDDGCCPNDDSMSATIYHIKDLYDPTVWNITGYGVKTDVASNTWCRAPGSTEGIAFIENIMEHIAKVTKKDPIAVRLANIPNKSDPIPGMINDMKLSSDYDKRVQKIVQFNKDNRWKKRGISLVPLTYPYGFFGRWYAMVSIYGMDGTIAVTHGAVEMGQGVNTKAAQVAAHILGVDLSLVRVKPTTNIVAPNNTGTGGSLGSESVAYAVKMCCEELNRRLEPIKKKLGAKASWKDIASAAYKEDINLNHSYMFTPKDDVKSYVIYGVMVTEVEIDVLTGQYHICRVDVLEDAGQSLSPEVDIGQIEGALVMGLGYFTSEEIVFHPETGANLTTRTWNYKPPGAKDIPIDFRVSFLKNAPNVVGVLGSKATGEPPFCMSVSVVFAIRQALDSARDEGGNTDWANLSPPFTAEKIWLGALTKTDMMKL